MAVSSTMGVDRRLYSSVGNLPRARKYMLVRQFQGEPKESDFQILDEELPPLKMAEGWGTLLNMVVAKKYVVLAPFVGEAKKDDFAIEEETLPAIKDGEFLAEALYLSVDPYQKVKIGETFPCDMIGGQIAKVIESKNPEYPVDCLVMGHLGWRTHTVVEPGRAARCPLQPYLYRLPDLGTLPPSLGIGLLGRVGNSAYFGLTEICKPEAGQTLAVTGAAGAVGSHVGQIAKILGCKVIGFAGTDEKCRWLTEELGFDYAFNYKTADIEDSLRAAAPDGVDRYFDNVGGELSSIILSHMNVYGRVAVCGAISSYNATTKQQIKATYVQRSLISKQLRLEGFQVNRFADRTAEGILQNLEWLKQGKLKYKEHIVNGFENAVDAFVGMFRGENTGKTIVKV